METSDLFRTMLDAWNRREMESVAGFLHADFEWVEHDAGPHGAPVYTGTSAMGEVTAGIEEGWADYRAEVIDVVPVDPERSVAVTRETGRGPASGVSLSTDFGYVVTIRDGKIARVEAYRDPRDAFAAVGHTDRSGA